MKDRLLWTRVDAGGAVAGEGGDAIVPWWSLTKPAIAAAALRLAAAGRLDLDAPTEAGVGLRAVLRHAAGLPDYGALPAYGAAVAAGGDPWPADELLARAAALSAPAGWCYSNVGYLLARRALERSENAPLAQVLRDWVLDPLGLTGPRLAESRADLAGVDLVMPGYHPGWVYHGLPRRPGRRCGRAPRRHPLRPAAGAGGARPHGRADARRRADPRPALARGGLRARADGRHHAGPRRSARERSATRPAGRAAAGRPTASPTCPAPRSSPPSAPATPPTLASGARSSWR